VSYETSKKSRVFAFVIIGFVIFAVVAFGQRYTMIELYFNTVLSHCKTHYSIPLVKWNRVLAFDAEVRHIQNMSDAEARMIDCTYWWSWIVVDDRGFSGTFEKGRDTLGVTISGQNLVPSQRIFEIYRTFVVQNQPILINSENDVQKN
jgi:hypothetical protein